MVCHQQVDLLFRLRKPFQCFKYFRISFRVHPVVGIHHLEIRARGVRKLHYHGIAMAPVFLVDGPHHVRITALILIRKPCRIVRGAIVHGENFHPLSARQQRFHSAMEILLRIVAGDDYRQHLRGFPPSFSDCALGSSERKMILKIGKKIQNEMAQLMIMVSTSATASPATPQPKVVMNSR